MTNCLNCDAKIAEGKRFCDYLCRQGYTNRTVTQFNKEFKEILQYYD